MPLRELREALQGLSRAPGNGAETVADLEHRLFWLGWHTIHMILDDEWMQGYPGYQRGNVPSSAMCAECWNAGI
jgi:hypothetical protein